MSIELRIIFFLAHSESHAYKAQVEVAYYSTTWRHAGHNGVCKCLFDKFFQSIFLISSSEKFGMVVPTALLSKQLNMTLIELETHCKNLKANAKSCIFLTFLTFLTYATKIQEIQKSKSWRTCRKTKSKQAIINHLFMSSNMAAMT